MKNIILCADDYGQNIAISQAILDLISKDRISAASCMTTTQDWISHAAWLVPYQNKIAVGLHFNLTEGVALTSDIKFMSLYHLIIKAALRRLNQQSIEKECHAQIDQFVTGMGRLPDFIDGHQHIHQFPVVREAIFNTLEFNYIFIFFYPTFKNSGLYITAFCSFSIINCNLFR